MRSDLPPISRSGARPASAEIGATEFDALRTLIQRETGIALGDAKRDMLCARLARRLRHLGLATYAEYYAHLTQHDPEGAELARMINCVTTNKTDFFREAHHFDFLRDRVFPDALARAQQGGARRLRIWSAGCSSGEEPYTLALAIREHFGPPAGWDVKILASDIDSDVLAHAEAGVYDAERLRDVPADLRGRYFLMGRGQDDGLHKVHPDLQALIAFRRINLMQDAWPIHTKFDVIFCRNVMIYFDRPTQQRLLERMAQLLTPDGFLIVGHSENLHGITDRLAPLGNTVYSLKHEARSDSVQPPAGANASGEIFWALPPALALRAEIAQKTIIAGEVFASKTPACLSTLLGSCVAACLFDPVAQVGGMNHFMLPEDAGNGIDPACFGVHAMELLINAIAHHGGDRRRLQAKVFGGARLLDFKGNALSIGACNATFIRAFLAAESIPIVSEYLGGATGLKVRFFTHTGQAFVKGVDGEALAEIVRLEKRRSFEIANLVQPKNNITLF